MKTLSLSISNPCQENWYKMSTAEHGRYCASCEKIVADFTQMSDAEIIRFISASTQNHCGRFRSSQLERDLFPENTSVKRASYTWSFLVAGWLSVSFASCKTEQVLPQKEMVACSPNHIRTDSQTFEDSAGVVRGFIKDKSNGEACIGATIHLKNTKISAFCNQKGYFSFVLPQNYPLKEARLIISYVGYKTREIPYAKLTTGIPSFYLDADDNLLGEVVFVGKVQPKKGR